MFLLLISLVNASFISKLHFHYPNEEETIA